MPQLWLNSRPSVSYLEEGAAPGLFLVAVWEVGEASAGTVEDEPTTVPCAELWAHLVQVAAARDVVQRHMAAELDLVAGALDVRLQVQSLASDWQVTRQGPLQNKKKMVCYINCDLISTWAVGISFSFSFNQRNFVVSGVDIKKACWSKYTSRTTFIWE